MSNIKMSFADLRELANGKGEANDCSVKAVCVVTGEDYDKVHALFAELGRKRRQGTKATTIELAVKKLGYSMRKVDVSNARTVQGLERRLPETHPALLAYVSGHVLGVLENEAIDWTHDRLHRLQSVFEIHATGTMPKKAFECNSKPQKKFQTRRAAIHTKCGQIWEYLDTACHNGEDVFSADFKKDPEFVEFCDSIGASKSTRVTQHACWRSAQ